VCIDKRRGMEMKKQFNQDGLLAKIVSISILAKIVSISIFLVLCLLAIITIVPDTAQAQLICTVSQITNTTAV
jgi:hypothetical protein